MTLAIRLKHGCVTQTPGVMSLDPGSPNRILTSADRPSRMHVEILGGQGIQVLIIHCAMEIHRLNRRAGTALVLALSGDLAQKAQAVTFNFNWQGDLGYSVQGTFSYDAGTAPAILSESGAGPTSNLQSLSVAFFDPANIPLQSFTTVVGGVSGSPYFAFNFDTTSSALIGSLNIGGGTGVIGEQFFSGTLGSLLRLRQDIDQQGASFEIDRQNAGVVSVTPIPEPAPLPGALALAGVALAALARRRVQSPGRDIGSEASPS